jgi:Predicted membrane protein
LLAIFAFSSLEASTISPLFALTGLGIFVLGSVLTGGWFYLVWKNFSFEVTSDTFDIRSGVIRKQRREIPLHRIQNVDVRRNIFQRVLGIAKVNLETAGGKTSEASLKFVEFEESKNIQEKVRKLKEDEEVEREETSDDALFEISEKELGILSAASLDWKALSVIFVGLSVFGGVFSSLESVFSLSGLALVVPLVFGLILLSFVFSVVSTVNKFYGFSLYRRGDSLEYERGLFNRSEGSIPFEKIQNLRIEENPLKRLLGYATLKVETAGYSGQSQEEKGPEVAVPIAERSRVDELSNKIFNHENYSIQGISRNAFKRYFTRYTLGFTLIFTVLTIASSFLLDTRIFFEIYAFALPVAGVAAYLKYKNKGFYEGKRFFYTMNGFWNRKTTITPYYRIQNLSMIQNIFQKRLVFLHWFWILLESMLLPRTHSL